MNDTPQEPEKLKLGSQDIAEDKRQELHTTLYRWVQHYAPEMEKAPAVVLGFRAQMERKTRLGTLVPCRRRDTVA